MSMRFLAGVISAFYNPFKVPNAPTIGTATEGEAQATVTFTAPTDVGGGAITGYAASAFNTSNGTSISATGAASPITVTGLTNGASYTMNAWAINAFGPSAFSASSNSVIPINPYYIGILKPSSGNYILGGDIYNSVTSGGMFVVGGDTTSLGRIQKLNYDGTISFQNLITVSGASLYYQSIANASSGSLYAAGYNSGDSPWITKFNSSGTVTWAIKANSLAYDNYGITTDASENVYFQGNKNASVSHTGSNRAVLWSVNSSGTNRWQTDYGTGTSSVLPGGISTYSASVFFACTWYNPSFVKQGVFVKLSQAAGALELQRLYSSSNGAASSRFYSIAQSASTGNCYIGGEADPVSLILKVDAAGAKQWATTIATGRTICKVAIDSSENVYALVPSNTTDKTLSVSKYNSSGTIQWQRNLTLPFDVSGKQSISVTSSGQIFITSGMVTAGLVSYPVVALLRPDGAGTGTYTIDGQTYTYAASSYTVSTDAGTFSAAALAVAAQTRTVSSLTTASATDNLTFIETAI